jgi:hypothetical protein
LAFRRVPFDKDKGFVKHKDPGRCVSTAYLGSLVEDQSFCNPRYITFGGRVCAPPTIDTAINHRP